MGHPAGSSTPSPTVGVLAEEETPSKKGWRKHLESARNWWTNKNEDEWLKDMRGNLSLVATVISTMTFQVAVNPPGGVLQASKREDIDNCSDDPCPGEAVLASSYRTEYFQFIVCNTICFIASITVCLLLLSGLPLNHRFPMWLLSIGMCIALTFLALTYFFGLYLVTPDPVWGETFSLSRTLLIIWIILLGIVGVFLTIRFVVWVVNLWIRKSKTSKTPRNDNHISVNRA